MKRSTHLSRFLWVLAAGLLLLSPVMTANVSAQAWGLPEMSAETKACVDCHKDEEPPTLAELIHIAHYDESHRNGFVQKYDGDCLHCHGMDDDKGESFVKSGEKNW